MPQLDPSPWFAILLFSWLIFLVIIPVKVTAHFFPNTPTVKDTKTHKNPSWAWLWH